MRVPFALTRPLVVLGAVLAGCSLIDPLDDISGGVRDGGGPGDDGEGGGDGSGEAAADAKEEPFVCKGPKESEPNGSPSQANVLAAGTTCGSIDGDDTDFFAFTFNGTSASLDIRLDAPEPLTFTVIVDVGGTVTSNTFVAGEDSPESVSGSDITFTVSVQRGSATAPSVPYALMLTGL